LNEAQELCDRVAIMEHGRLVAMGTASELAGRLGRGHRLKLEVGPGDEEKALRLLAEAPGVSAGREEGAIVAAVMGREIIPGLVASLASAGVRIYRVAPQEASLEDIYFALHGGQEELS
jgi:ABC-2 type transport system ATP-binding protein